MILKPYPEYRDSDLLWLGQIPKHWEEKRLKFLFSEIDDRSDTGQETLLSMRQQHGLVPHNEVSDKEFKSGELVGYKRTHVNDVVMNRMRASSGLFARTPMYGLVSPDYAVFRKRSEINVEYYVHLFKSPLMQAEFRAESKGLGTGSSGFLRLYSDRFGAISVPLPSREEQDRIVSFIQAADEVIARLIRAKQQLIELLNEQKQAIIHRAVTCGLDPDAPTRPTGLDWLPEVPEHWEVKPLKQVAAVRLSGVDKHSLEGEQNILLCNYTDVYNNDFIDCGIDFMPATATEAEIEAFTLKAGDVLITKDSEAADDIAVPALVREDLNDVLCGYHLALVRPVASSVSEEYLFRVFSEVSISRQFHVAATGVTRFGISKQDIKNALVLLPPLGEQGEICRWIVDEVEMVDAAVQRARREINLIREYRTRLVSDVVTGKLDVRGTELPEPVAGDKEAGIIPNGIESLVTEELSDTEEAFNADL